MSNQINLACAYDIEEDELTVIGETASLKLLVKNLNDGQSNSFSLFSITVANFNGQPLNQLEIKITLGKVIIDTENNNKIIISGSGQALNLLSISIRNLYAPKFPSKFSSKHNHIEYFPEHPFLAAVSKSLIVYLVEGLG